VSTLRNGRLGLKGFTDGDRRLAGVFDLSYQMLAVGHRLAFRRLALIPGPYTDRYALAALLGADPVLAESLLQDLVDHSLLTEPSPGCYRMHDLIREHAGTLSEADPDQQRDLALGRLLHYYAHTAQQASQSIARYPRPVPEGQAPTYAPELSSPDTARSWLRAEWPNLDAAHATAHNRALHEPVIALAAGLAEMLQVYGPWSRALNIHQTAATTAERHGRPTAHATALTDLGRVRHLTGDYSGADEAFTRALEIYRAQGDRLGEANVLTGLGCIGYLTGDYSGAGDTVTAALEIFRSLGHRHGEGIVLVDLGNMQQTTGDHSGSIDALTRALEIFRALGHRHGEATALTDLGRVRHLTGDHAGADEAHTQALEIYHALGIRLGEANALTGLGSVRQATGDYRGAVDALARALEIYRALGHRGNEACALNDYAATHAALGQRPRALALYQQALAMNRELNKPDDEAISLEGIAEHHLATGEPTQGTAYLHQALELYRRLGMKPDTERIRARLDGLTSPPPDQHVPADPVVGVST
jgi:tetratricopeptide (TPR) repeat protein